MIRFEVTGATPEEFAENAMKAWGLLAIGLQRALSAQPAIAANSDGLSPPPTSPTSATSSPPLQAQTNGSESSSTASKGDEVSEQEVDFAMEMNRRGGLIREKIDERERKKLASDKVDDLFVESGTTSDGSSPVPKQSEKPKSGSKGSKAPKLDDLKTRLSEVIVAATDRWDQKRANTYARKLLKEFAVEKLSELEAEQYGAFMHGSNPYLSGDIAE